jgi:hypothetical protein
MNGFARPVFELIKLLESEIIVESRRKEITYHAVIEPINELK